MLREPNSTNHFAKNHFFSLPLFRPDNAIFHNIDNISIFCKILKICRINGYWVEYNYLMFGAFEKAIKNPLFFVFLKVFLIFFVLIYIIMPDFSQLFCNFGGEFCAWCAGKYKHIKNIR